MSGWCDQRRYPKKIKAAGVYDDSQGFFHRTLVAYAQRPFVSVQRTGPEKTRTEIGGWL